MQTKLNAFSKIVANPPEADKRSRAPLMRDYMSYLNKLRYGIKASIRFKGGVPPTAGEQVLLNRIGMHIKIIKSMRIPLRGATQPLSVRCIFETAFNRVDKESVNFYYHKDK